MIVEEEKLGVKIAENPEEAFWENLKVKRQEEILNLKREIIINENLIKLCEERISKP